MSDYFTVKQAAAFLEIRPVTIRYHLAKGNIKGDKSRGMWLIHVDELKKLVGVKPGPRPITSE
jgi:hypothetical protein